MNLEDQFELGHLVFAERKCRVCGNIKNLIENFYKIRKNYTISSSYSYECRECTIKRVKEYNKKKIKINSFWEYPDW